MDTAAARERAEWRLRPEYGRKGVPTKTHLEEELARDVLALAGEVDRLQAIERSISDLRANAENEPIDIDISDFSDHWCHGFLAGQANALDALLHHASRSVAPGGPPGKETAGSDA